MSEAPGASLVAMAREVTAQQSAELVGVWQRSAALVARQALETAVKELLAVRAPGTERASARAQLLCLPTYAPDELAYRARYLWAVLSRACHHHPYELAPTAVELDDWLASADRLIDSLAASYKRQVASDAETVLAPSAATRLDAI